MDDFEKSGIGSQLENMASLGRELEEQLLREREYSEELRQYATVVLSKLRERESQLQAQSVKLQTLHASYRKACVDLNESNTHHQKTRSELARFQAVWTEISERDKKVQKIIHDFDVQLGENRSLELKIKDLSNQLEFEKIERARTDRQLSVQRQELQVALLRAHAGEAHANELSREFEAAENKLRIEQGIERASLIEAADAAEKKRAQADTALANALQDVAMAKSELSALRKASELWTEEQLTALQSEYERKMGLLRVECALAFELLTTERSRAKAIADGLLDEWDRPGSELCRVLERDWLENWQMSLSQRSVQARMIAAAPETSAKPPTQPKKIVSRPKLFSAN